MDIRWNWARAMCWDALDQSKAVDPNADVVGGVSIRIRDPFISS